jgi:hypothetical protein
MLPDWFEDLICQEGEHSISIPDPGDFPIGDIGKTDLMVKLQQNLVVGRWITR